MFFMIITGYYDEELDSFIEIEGLPENCKIYVPDQSFGAYRTSFGKHAMQEDGVDTYSIKFSDSVKCPLPDTGAAALDMIKGCLFTTAFFL